VLTFAREHWNSDGPHSTSINTSRLTVITSGRYLIVGNNRLYRK
jgi:hypothetical protein